MSIISPQQFEMLLPLACIWAAEQERVILQSGAAITDSQLADARRVGVAEPDRIRLFRDVQIPSPTHPALAAAASATGLISPLTTGLTLRYGIFMPADCWGERCLIVHQCVHTMQYERLWGVLKDALTHALTNRGIGSNLFTGVSNGKRHAPNTLYCNALSALVSFVLGLPCSGLEVTARDLRLCDWLERL